MRAQMHLERGHEAGRQVILGRANGDPRSDRRNGLVADVLVDHVRRLPQLRHVHPGPVTEPVERLGERLAGDAVQCERERVDGGRDEICARLDGGERGRERRSRRALHVEADRQLAGGLDPPDQFLRPVREERAGRVVHDHARRAELAELARLLDERVRLRRPPGPVDEAGVESASDARNRRSRLAQVGDVVQRVVQPEDLDAVLGRAADEPPDDIAADGSRAHEEAPSQRDPERRRHARLDPADALPRALDTPAYRRVEDAAPRDLEAGEPGVVEDVGNAEDLRRREAPGEGLLREEPDSRVDELRHDVGTLAPCSSDRSRPLERSSAPRRHLRRG